MLFLIGTFGLNFPIFISTMAVSVFHAGAGGYGLLTSTMAVGSVTGALLAARRKRRRSSARCSPAPRCSGSAGARPLMPSYWLFGVALVVIGVAAQTFTTTVEQPDAALDRAGHARARDGASLGVALGGTPIGAPIVGWVADTFGPRWALGVGAAGGLVAALIGLVAAMRALRRTAGPERSPAQAE